MRVLILDDSRAMRAILRQMMQGLGFEVLEAADGRAGLGCLQANGRADLALVDWNMPEMDGLEFVHSVRANHAYDKMRLMMVTTETEVTNVSEALTAGADEYVMKPFTKEVIRDKLELLGMLEESVQ